MISLKTMAAAAAAMVVIGSGAALAKDAKKPATPVVHSPQSIECSKEADAKGLHGKSARSSGPSARRPTRRMRRRKTKNRKLPDISAKKPRRNRRGFLFGS